MSRPVFELISKAKCREWNNDWITHSIITQEDLIRISRFYDLAPENPKVDMSEALQHLPVTDIIKNIKKMFVDPKGLHCFLLAEHEIYYNHWKSNVVYCLNDNALN